MSVQYKAVITLAGVSRTVSEWAATLGIPAGTIDGRRKRGASPEACLVVGIRRGGARGSKHPWDNGPAV